MSEVISSTTYLFNEQKALRLMDRLSNCDLCPRRCLVDRTKGEEGECKTGKNLKVASYQLHFGEEQPISGFRGSGTIFMAGCNLSCAYCQNYDISQDVIGREISERQFVEMMLSLQDRGAHNINIVTPSHFTAQLLYALEMGKSLGVYIPIVYNSSGYDSVDILREFEGLVDIYMPDIRYSDNVFSGCYSEADDYPEINKAVIKEMYRQVGNLQIGGDGIAKKGLLVRHLVLPNDISNSEKAMKFLADEISSDTYISLMSQYHPTHKVDSDDKINRRLTSQEYNQAVEITKKYKLTNCRFQGNNH